jgi:membrane protein YdbS with pleckstrin-like domain
MPTYIWILIGLILAGVILYYVKMEPRVKTIIVVVIIVALLIYLANIFGVWPGHLKHI